MMRVAGYLFMMTMGLVPGAVSAQDTARADQPRRAEELRQMIDQRFGQRVKEDLGLTDEQAVRLRGVLASVAERRRMLQVQERQLRMALANQLRPGIAANADSVAKLVNALTAQRVAFAQTFQDEMGELAAFLTPVQRGQYLILRDRLMLQAERMRQEAMLRGQPGPGARPGRRPPAFQ